MTDLISLGADVGWPDHERANAARARLADSAPLLGRLADIAEWVAAVIPTPGRFRAVRAVVIGAPAGEAAQQAADEAQVAIRLVVDLSDSPTEALAAGAALADSEIDAGADLLIVAAPGIGADSALAVSVLTNTEPVKVLTRGAAATDPDAWMALATEVRDRRRHAIGLRDDADKLLEVFQSPRLAAIAGFGLQAAIRRTPVVLDGPTAAAGALLAHLAQPRAARWWCAADLGPDALQQLALLRLGQSGLLALGTGLGDGLAGVLSVQLLQTAARLGA